MALAFYFKSHRENQGESMGEKASQKVFTVHGHDYEWTFFRPNTSV